MKCNTHVSMNKRGVLRAVGLKATVVRCIEVALELTSDRAGRSMHLLSYGPYAHVLLHENRSIVAFIGL